MKRRLKIHLRLYVKYGLNVSKFTEHSEALTKGLWISAVLKYIRIV